MLDSLRRGRYAFCGVSGALRSVRGVGRRGGIGGYFIPPDPTRRYGTLPKKLVVQAEDVLVDTRGFIYITEKNQGLWIVQYTGPK